MAETRSHSADTVRRDYLSKAAALFTAQQQQQQQEEEEQEQEQQRSKRSRSIEHASCTDTTIYSHDQC